MIITRTPFRISFFGGGTDYPEWFNEHSGVVLATAIDKYCYVGIRNGKEWSSFDLPSRSGMGTSSAYTVGLLKTSVKKDNRAIAQLATVIERDKLSGRVGYQDQFICAVGGFRLVKFYPTGIKDTEIENVDWLNKYLMLFDTCKYRSAGEVVVKQLENIKDNYIALSELCSLTLDGVETLSDLDYRGFGRLLSEAWGLKKSLSDNVSTPEIDAIYNKAIKAGAIGGKLLGAGGGGFMLFLAEPDQQEKIEEELGLNRISFNFDYEGTKLIYDIN